MGSRGIKDKTNIFARLLIVFADLLMLLAGYYATYLIIGMFDVVSLEFPPVNLFFYAYAVLYVIMAFGMDMYSFAPTTKSDIILSMMLVNVVSFVASIIFDHLFVELKSGLIIILFSALSAVLTIALKLVVNKLLIIFKGRSNLLVIEAKGVDDAFVRKIKYSSLGNFNSWYTQVDMDSEDAVEAFLNGEFTEYGSIFITQAIPENVRKRIIWEAMDAGKEIYISPSLFDIKITKYELMQFDDILSFRIKPLSIPTGSAVAKRLMDIGLSAIGLLLSLPLTIAAAIVIKLTSPGPIFYWQERVTKDGAIFKVYKFRTMIKDAEKYSGPVLATDNDPRITKVGKIMRATRIDELPQLINVLKGDMSIVGPRPERPEFVKQFTQEIEDYDKRLGFKAGLTGYAQVYARYDTTAKDKLLYDLIYIHEYSFWLDIKIIILTVKTLFTKEASAGVKEKDYHRKRARAQQKQDQAVQAQAEVQTQARQAEDAELSLK